MLVFKVSFAEEQLTLSILLLITLCTIVPWGRGWGDCVDTLTSLYPKNGERHSQCLLIS